MKTELLKIKKAVEEYTGIEDIGVKDRSHDIAMARWLYCKLCREHTNGTMSAIGKLINRDHSTVVHAVKSLEFEFAYNKDLQTKYEDLSIIVVSKIKMFSLDEVERLIIDFTNKLQMLKLQRKKLLNESTYSELEDQKDVQVFWS